MSLLEKRTEAARAAKAAASLTGETAFVMQNSDNDNIATKLERALKTAALHELEDSPRNTVIRFLSERQLDEIFSFKVDLGRGGAYVQAMRQVLSRAREKAHFKKKQLDEFKVFTISIKSEADHDVVQLLRSKNMTPTEASVYDEITDLFERKPKEVKLPTHVMK